MAQKIIYKKRFLKKLDKLLTYLEKEWSLQATSDFLDKLEEKIEFIKTQPETGAVTLYKNVRYVLVTGKNRIYYRIVEDRIEVLNMIDTRRDPRKNPFNKK